MKRYKVIFFGTPDFAVPTLEALIKDERFQVIAVVTEPDRKAGRGKKIVFSPVKKFIEDYNKCHSELVCPVVNFVLLLGVSESLRSRLPPRSGNEFGMTKKKIISIFQPEKIQAISYKLKAKSFDVAVLAAYGQIIPQEILEIPKYGFVNIHPSLLPKYRGPSPIQAAILNGDQETGVTIMKMDEKMDHGEILRIMNYELRIMNFQELSKKLSEIASKLLIETLPVYLGGKIKPQPQNHKKATYTKLIKKSDGEINWNESAEIIERKIRAYYPWPGTHTVLHRCTNNTNHTDCKRLKIIKAHLGNKKLVLDQVQLEGRKPVGWKEFLKGYKQTILFVDKIG